MSTDNPMVPGDRNQFPAPHEGTRDIARPSTLDALLPAELRHGELPPDDALDLAGYWAILRKHRWLILLVTGVILAATLVGTLLTPATFRATTLLQIDREALKVVEFEGDQRQVESAGTNDFYQTQYELLKSRTLADRVATKLGLGQSPEFRKLYPSVMDDASGGASRSEVQLAAEQRGVVDVIQYNTNIQPIRNSRLVRVSFDSPDAAFSAQIANAYADAFIGSTLERRFDASTYAKTFLEERLAQLKQKLEESEKQLVGFAQKENIVTSDEGQSLSSQNLVELNTALAQAQAQRIRAEARWRQASSSRGAGLPADMLGASIVRTLQERRAQLAAQYQEKLSTYQPGFPAMVQLKGQIDEVDRQITQELRSIRTSVKAEYDAALRQESLLSGKMGAVRGDVLDLQNRSIQYNILKREVDTNRQLYDALLQRYKEVGVAGGVSTNNVSVVDRAQIPLVRFKPSITRNLALALLGGLLLGVLLAFVMERVDDTVRGPEEVEKLLNLPVLGSVPLLKEHTPQQAELDLRSGFAEAYRSVRTALQFSTENGAPRRLLISSAMPGEGKSTTALLLAHNFAQLGQRVLVVEADLRNPSLHRTLDLDNSYGLSSYLAGSARPADVIRPGDRDNLWVLPSGPLPPNPVELLSSAKMAALVHYGLELYDQIILDGPPIMGLADVPLLSRHVDGVVLTVAAGRTRRAALKASLKRLMMARARLIGAVVTMYDPKRAGAAYGYADSAYYSYGADPVKQLPR